LSGVDVYAFDFTVDWSSVPLGWISLVSGTPHSPWLHFFTIDNSNTTNTYHISMTAIPPSTGLLTVDQSVLTLVFHIDQDVCYPTIITGDFEITGVKMSSDGTVPVPIVNMEIDNGDITISAPQLTSR
jgi:hypothetical protein